MRAFVDKILAQLKEYLDKMDKKGKRRLIILSLLVVVFAIVAVVLLSQTNYVTFYNARSIDEARQIYNVLQGEDIPASLDGVRVLVPESSVGAATRATQGLTGPAQMSYDILGEASGFSVTDAHAKRLVDAQNSEHLSTQIRQSPKINNALVTITTGETSAFRSANVRPSIASVMLILADGQALTQPEVQSIADLVKTTVPGILYENITITDDKLSSYRFGDVDDDMDMIVSSRVALTNILTQQLKASAEQLLAPIFMLKNIQITPNVRLNFDRVSETIIEFAPPVAGELDGLVRSSSEMYELQRYREDAGGIPGTDTNAMGMGEYPYGTLEDEELYKRSLIEKNYELNETLTIIEREQGVIDTLSIAVLLNSEYLGEDYTEEAIVSLVQMGLGISPANITVQTLSFVEDTSMQDAFDAWAAHDEQMRERELINTIIMWSVILLFGILLFSLIRTIIKGSQPVPEPMLVDATGVDYITDDDDEAAFLLELASQEREEIELQKKQTELEDIEKFIDKDPGAVAQLLRNWLADD